jgi:hypothetical protein
MCVHAQAQGWHAGATPITWIAFSAGLRRDWAREATVPALTRVYAKHPGAFGTGLRWEWQVLGEVGAR